MIDLKVLKKYNLTAIVDPTVTDDDSLGYKVGSLWINTVTNKSYLCVNTSIGAAVWTSLDSTTSPGSYQLKNQVIVNPDLDEIVGRRYQSIANALVYVATQIPSTINRWDIIFGGNNTEGFTIPDFVSIVGVGGDAILAGPIVSNTPYTALSPTVTASGDYERVSVFNCKIKNYATTGTNAMYFRDCTFDLTTPSVGGLLYAADCAFYSGDFSGTIVAAWGSEVLGGTYYNSCAFHQCDVGSSWPVIFTNTSAIYFRNCIVTGNNTSFTGAGTVHVHDCLWRKSSLTIVTGQTFNFIGGSIGNGCSLTVNSGTLNTYGCATEAFTNKITYTSGTWNNYGDYYDNRATGLTAYHTQSAIDELFKGVLSVSKKVTQTSHGFVVGDALYFNGTIYQKAIATGLSTAGLFVVSKYIDANTFILTQTGYIDTLSGLTAGAYYYVSEATAGLLTTSIPVIYSNPLFYAVSATAGYVLPFSSSAVGGSSTDKIIRGDTKAQVYDTSLGDTYSGFEVYVDGATSSDLLLRLTRPGLSTNPGFLKVYGDLEISGAYTYIGSSKVNIVADMFRLNTSLGSTPSVVSGANGGMAVKRCGPEATAATPTGGLIVATSGNLVFSGFTDGWDTTVQALGNVLQYENGNSANTGMYEVIVYVSGESFTLKPISGQTVVTDTANIITVSLARVDTYEATWLWVESATAFVPQIGNIPNAANIRFLNSGRLQFRNGNVAYITDNGNNGLSLQAAANSVFTTSAGDITITASGIGDGVNLASPLGFIDLTAGLIQLGNGTDILQFNVVSTNIIAKPLTLTDGKGVIFQGYDNTATAYVDVLTISNGAAAIDTVATLVKDSLLSATINATSPDLAIVNKSFLDSLVYSPLKKQQIGTGTVSADEVPVATIGGVFWMLRIVQHGTPANMYESLIHATFISGTTCDSVINLILQSGTVLNFTIVVDVNSGYMRLRITNNTTDTYDITATRLPVALYV